jgi:hypothetical protein
MSVDISNIVLKKIIKIRAFGLANDSLIAEMSLLKDTTFQNSAESVPIESQGVEIAQFDTKRAFALTGNQAIVTEGLLAIQTGVPVETVTNTSDIRYCEILTVTDDKAVTSFVAHGLPGKEIGWVYPRNPRNSFVDTENKIEQDIAVDAGKFTYDAATKELVFDDDVLKDGSEIIVFYYPVIKEAKKIVSRNDKFSRAALVEVDIAVEDLCTNEQYLGKFLIPNGKFSGAFNLSVDGTNPAVQNFEVKSQFDCSGTGELWKWFIYREEDIS